MSLLLVPFDDRNDNDVPESREQTEALRCGLSPATKTRKNKSLKSRTLWEVVELTLLIYVQKRVAVFVALHRRQLTVWGRLLFSIRCIVTTITVLSFHAPRIPRHLLSLQLRLNSDLLHLIHLRDALFQVLCEFHSVMFVARVKSYKNFVVDLCGQLNAMRVIWGKLRLKGLNEIEEKFARIFKSFSVIRMNRTLIIFIIINWS